MFSVSQSFQSYSENAIKARSLYIARIAQPDKHHRPDRAQLHIISRLGLARDGLHNNKPAESRRDPLVILSDYEVLLLLACMTALNARKIIDLLQKKKRDR